MSETHWLQGREAALNGKARETNPYGQKNGWGMWDDGWLHGDAEKNPTGPWIVNVLGDEATGQDIEISIVLNTNTHGQESYGWDGDEAAQEAADEAEEAAQRKINEAKDYGAGQEGIYDDILDQI